MPKKQQQEAVKPKPSFDSSKLLLDEFHNEIYLKLLTALEQSTHPQAKKIKSAFKQYEEQFKEELQSILKLKLKSKDELSSQDLLSSFLYNTPIIIQGVSFSPPENFLDFLKQILILDKILTTQDKPLTSDPQELKKFQELKDLKEVGELEKSQYIGRIGKIQELKIWQEARKIPEPERSQQLRELNESITLKETEELIELQELQKFRKLPKQEKLEVLNKNPIVKKALFKMIEKENLYNTKYTATLKANRDFIGKQSSTVTPINTQSTYDALIER